VTIAARISGESPTNQGRKERGGTNPSEDSLVFGSREELQVYRSLKAIQKTSPEDRTFTIVPLPGAHQRSGITVTPDFLIIGYGRAVVIEVDGPHHKKRGRYGADVSRDRHGAAAASESCACSLRTSKTRQLSSAGSAKTSAENFGRSRSS